jgi:Skp family chaperone for outer membrane proteins
VRGVLAAGLVLGAVWLGGSSLAIAQATDQETDGAISAVGVIDVQSVLRQSLAAQSIQEQIDARREAYQSQVTEEERALREAEQDLARKRAILSVEDYQTAVRDFQAEVADIQRKVQSRKRGLDEAFAKAMSEVRQKMVSAVAEIAEERGYDLVLFKNQIVIAAKSLDITEEVRRRLDEALPRVEVDLPPDE